MKKNNNVWAPLEKIELFDYLNKPILNNENKLYQEQIEQLKNTVNDIYTFSAITILILSFLLFISILGLIRK